MQALHLAREKMISTVWGEMEIVSDKAMSIINKNEIGAKAISSYTRYINES